MLENITKPFPYHVHNENKCFYLQLGEVTPSSLGSPVHFLVSVGRTTTRAGYESGSKVQHRNSISAQSQQSAMVILCGTSCQRRSARVSPGNTRYVNADKKEDKNCLETI